MSETQTVRHYGHDLDVVRRSLRRQNRTSEQIEYALEAVDRLAAYLAVASVQANRVATLRAEIEALPRWGMVSRGGEPYDLDHTKHGNMLDRGAVLRLLVQSEAEP